ncbi:hypothetical protein BGZ61DRAFT_412347 [Ilyonectria robusta]|uniref:uncharacterized protein n=1 Tax=Ilyonectria robusta TaxID=1079257 RepID=UPI001E8E8B5F|nr:uncharacterized protein BGZ61DRAFT_412347 [Ilyonectria robusta]KAH8734752.1 hypothetical protein BGZ61DRAFT_412347 [Ilyonectria robusta]
MAFLFPAPLDHRTQRLDDDFLAAAARGQAQRSTRANPNDAALAPIQGEFQSPAQLQDGAVEAVPPLQQLPPMQRKHLVFADPIAFRYLEDDSSVTVVERRAVLCGYESYLVEQWACSRHSPTLVITTYTGDQKHSILVSVLSVPAEESLWPVKLRVYFKAIHKFHARPKETSLGALMVTNLSSFPSALTVILVPEGDIRKYRQTFIVNEDLKRLGCSGRSGLTLNDPTETTRAKFQQLYKTSDRIPLSQAVMELIKLCQVALYMFEKLDHEYIDGLLCDMTETAINNWWTEVGAEHYNFEPTDGILGPSTVSALLGMLMGARNRLHWYGVQVSKDVFDIDSTKRGVGHFQKSQKLEKTRRLDRQTLLRLYSVSAKAAAGEGWGVQRAVKSTVTEIGGKRGELVMGIVSGKDKGGLADIETLDINRFVSLAYGERPKWLWHGKPRRTPTEVPNRTPELGTGMVWKEEADITNPKRLNLAPTEEEPELKRVDESPVIYSAYPPGSAISISKNPNDKDALPKTVFKSVAGKMSDARSGLGRIKDAVGGGLRGHNARPSVSTREEFVDVACPIGPGGTVQNSSLVVSPTPMVGVNRAFTWKNKPEEYLAAMRRGDTDAVSGLPQTSHFASTSTVDFKPSSAPGLESQKRTEQEGELVDFSAELLKDVLSKVPSAVGSLVDEADLQGPILEVEVKAKPIQLGLSRRHSIHTAGPPKKHVPNENRWPRRMSFGDAEEAVLTWKQIIDITKPTSDLASLEAYAEIAQYFNEHINSIRTDIEPWVSEKLKVVELLDERYDQDKEELQALYEQLNEACQRLRVSADEVLSEQRGHLTEGLKEVEVLIAKLDYEINALLQKVIDVEDGIITFERQVEDMEQRADALKDQLETEGWLHWAFRSLTGIGTGPDITRSML